MALILKDGSIFVHIPKTGGNWVTKVLYSQNLVLASFGSHKHVDIPHLFTGVGESTRKVASRRLRNIPAQVRLMLDCQLHGKPFIFSFVRHPLTWYESWFKYMNQAKLGWREYGNMYSLRDWHPCSALNGVGSTVFNEFIENVVSRYPGFVTQMFDGYTVPGLVDYVGRQENLREDLIAVLAQRGLEFDPDAIRGTKNHGVSAPPASLSTTWDPDLREQILKLEYASLVRYGYSEIIP